MKILIEDKMIKKNSETTDKIAIYCIYFNILDKSRKITIMDGQTDIHLLVTEKLRYPKKRYILKLAFPRIKAKKFPH